MVGCPRMPRVAAAVLVLLSLASAEVVQPQTCPGGVCPGVVPIDAVRGGFATDYGPVVANVVGTFKAKFGEDPTMVGVAPGRVNLIGEHTDYNDGFVLPCAIDFHVAAAMTPAMDSDELTVCAVDLDAEVKISLREPMVLDKTNHWSNYVRGVIRILQEEKGLVIKGGKLAIGGNVPRGGGLSSSAALEVAVGTILNHANSLGLEPRELALIGQSAEHWVGVKCGIMDQFISALGTEGAALLIDCRDLSTKTVQVPAHAAVVIINSNVKHQLAGLDSEYNSRRSQCEEAAKHFGVVALRDITAQQLQTRGDELSPLTLRRARHVVTENERTIEALSALEKGDLKAMAKLMAASHVSMRDDFEISVPEIDALVEIVDSVLLGEGGVRMTGAGFGGSVVCLCPRDRVEEVRAKVAAEYPERANGVLASFFVCLPSAGARILPLK